jgi:hypothetical protein
MTPIWRPRPGSRQGLSIVPFSSSTMALQLFPFSAQLYTFCPGPQDPN